MFSKVKKPFESRPERYLDPRHDDCQDILPADTTLSPINISDEPKTFTTPCGLVPTLLVNASKMIESHIMDRDLFQIQGSLDKVEYLNHVLSRNRLTMPRNTCVHDVTETVKVYLSRLSPEIIPEEIMTDLINIHQEATFADYFNVIQRYYDILPDVCPSVHFVLRLLNKVARHSTHNGMDARKLATIFVLDILKPLSRGEDSTEDIQATRLRRVQRLPYNIMAIEYLIHNVTLFQMALPLKPSELQDPGQRNNNKEQCTADPTHEAKHKGGAVSGSGLANKSPIRAECKQAPDDATALSGSCIHYKRSSPTKPVSKPFGSSASNKAQSGAKKESVSNNATISSKHGSVGDEKKGATAKDKTPIGGSTKAKETPRSRLKTQGVSSLRRRLRSHSDSSKDIANVKNTQRFKLNKRAKSKEGKYKSVGSKLFRTDEELLPWGGAGIQQTESEDVSLIVQSTQNPKTFQFLDNYHSMSCTPNKDFLGLETVHHLANNSQSSRKSRRNKNKCATTKRKPSNPRQQSKTRKTAAPATVTTSTDIKCVQTDEDYLLSLSPLALPPQPCPKPQPPKQAAATKASTTPLAALRPPPLPPTSEHDKLLDAAFSSDRTESTHPTHTATLTTPQHDTKYSSILATPSRPSKPPPPSVYTNYRPKRLPITETVGYTEYARPRPMVVKKSLEAKLRNERKKSALTLSNVIEWLCDVFLIVIACVCAIYIYHLIRI